MIAHIRGVPISSDSRSLVIDVGGIGVRVVVPLRTLGNLAHSAGPITLATHLHVREDAWDLYGFPASEDLALFRLLIGVSGVGPKSAIAILDAIAREDLEAAIASGRVDLLVSTPGIGKKTAERIVLELRDKVCARDTDRTIGAMEGGADVLDALVELGYRREQAREVLGRLDPTLVGVEERFKAALKLLGKRSGANSS